MNFLSAMEATLPPGFRFHPRDEELVSYYLANKVSGNRLTCTDSCDSPPYMVEVDLNKTEPWDLPEVACVGGKEWYFFSLRDRKYATGLRTNRATLSGYWKATGKDRQVVDLQKGSLVGMRKTLVFYQGRAPKGKKTDWVMHEYRLEGPAHNPKITPKEDWVLCRVLYKKRGISSKQNQESYDDDTPSFPSLPPLSDNKFLPFNQTPLNLEGSDQVPCFSSFSQNNTNPTFPHIPHLPDPNYDTFPQIEPVPDFANFLDLPSCEKTLLKAVLDNLTNSKMTEAPPSLGEVVRLESYLSEMGLPCLWNHFSF